MDCIRSWCWSLNMCSVLYRIPIFSPKNNPWTYEVKKVRKWNRLLCIYAFWLVAWIHWFMHYDWNTWKKNVLLVYKDRLPCWKMQFVFLLDKPLVYCKPHYFDIFHSQQSRVIFSWYFSMRSYLYLNTRFQKIFFIL